MTPFGGARIIETASQYPPEVLLHAAGLFAEYLARRGLKMTRERRSILDAVLSLKGHFEIDQLLARLSQSGTRVSRATVYRTLPRLVDAGLVHKLEMAEGQTRYEPMFGRPHHDHMICLGCGRIVEFESREIERLQEEVCRRKRFRMTEHTHQIRGFCEACDGQRPKDAGSAGIAPVILPRPLRPSKTSPDVAPAPRALPARQKRRSRNR